MSGLDFNENMLYGGLVGVKGNTLKVLQRSIISYKEPDSFYGNDVLLRANFNQFV